jgi:hypothetical protein
MNWPLIILCFFGGIFFCLVAIGAFSAEIAMVIREVRASRDAKKEQG